MKILGTWSFQLINRSLTYVFFKFKTNFPALGIVSEIYSTYIILSETEVH